MKKASPLDLRLEVVEQGGSNQYRVGLYRDNNRYVDGTLCARLDDALEVMRHLAQQNFVANQEPLVREN